jgi:CRP-like cAMP-binding protein
MHSDSLVSLLIENPLFDGLRPQERDALAPWCSKRRFAPGEALIVEGARSRDLYILAAGSARVLKATSRDGVAHELRVIHAGETAGEMKLAGVERASASVVAVDEVEAWCVDVGPILDGSCDPSLRAAVTANVARILAGRVRASSAVAADAIQERLEQSEARESAGRFIVYLFGIMSAYALFVAVLHDARPESRPGQVWLSLGVILGACAPIAAMVRSSPYSLASYGLTLRGWPRVVGQATLYTLPILAALLAAKALWVTLGAAGEPLFRYDAIFEDGRFRPGQYALALTAYALLSAAQEFFARAGLQGSLQKFLPRADGGTNWTAIVLANLIFASAHTYLGARFLLAAFVPGLFWGWLFERQRSLLGVSVSHALVGVWALFVLGVQGVVGGH